MRYRWNARGVDLDRTEGLLVELTRSRSRISGGLVRLRPTRGEGRSDRVGGEGVEVPLELLGSRRAVAALPTALAGGTADVELELVADRGRPLVGAFVLLRVRDGAPADPVPRPVEAELVPDWVVGEELFRERFGTVGPRRRAAFARRVVAVDLRPHADLLARRAESLAGAVLLFDEFEARERALEAKCAIERYFTELDRRTSPPAIVADGKAALFDNGRDKLEDRLDERAVYGAGGKRWVPPPLSTSSKILLTPFVQHVTQVFVDADGLLPAPLGGVDPFGWAYELFVAGRLAVAHPVPLVHWLVMHHGAPDGVPFLLFAELAALSIQLGHRVDFWGPRYEHLVRAAVLFQAHPATDAALEQELGVGGVPPQDLYTFYDGKVATLRTVFDLRERHAKRLSGLTEGARRTLLDDALTWVAGRVIGAGGGSPPADAPDLEPAEELFLEGQLGGGS